ncbi:alcohol dehydrogenase catalytic domain-containing protein [Clostridium sp. CF011]|uniref:zinc-dependent alcohol dehydrogenase n=1 Tax=Clostridium sp. CF011 TaxID=2843318 RepID=UPI001C0E5C9B|nr:alcohol dehydrogenase catalytic domain-containing protein [Clostridium sp. CF011]MBU3093405.1 alcohol dehydrogenase catalytic domain-containing protein [Clostridium sp. CF011]WAG71250.1 alcohol dehydrogenase catalytic domain-containing protein [Clostridium sp. CF011]
MVLEKTELFKNKAVMLSGPQKIEVKEIKLNPIKDGEILIKVNYVALCGSDIKLYEGKYLGPHSYPIILGHEWVGKISYIGENVKGNWNIGDLVTGDCSIYCDECTLCKENKNQCDNVEKRGITIDGACAQYIIENEKYIYHCPKISKHKAFVLAEPMAVAVQAITNRIEKSKLKKINNALVLGAGGIGVMSLFVLRELGIPNITVADIESKKLELISSFDYSNVNTVNMDFKDSIGDSNNCYDLIIEATGSGEAFKKALILAERCGTVICIGHQNYIDLDFGTVIKKALSVYGSIGGTGGFEKAIQIIEKNSENISKVITETIPLDDVEKEFIDGLKISDNIKIAINLQV